MTIPSNDAELLMNPREVGPGYAFALIMNRGDGSRMVQTECTDEKRAKSYARSARMKRRSPTLYRRGPDGWTEVKF